MQAKLPFPQLGLDYSVRMWQPVGRLVHIAVAQLRFFLRHLSFRDPYRAGFIRDQVDKGTTAFLPLVEKRDIKLNLGCGPMHLDGYINVDGDPKACADFYLDFAELGDAFAPESATDSGS